MWRYRVASAVVFAAILATTGCPIARVREHRVGVGIRDVDDALAARATRMRGNVERLAHERSFQDPKSLEVAATTVVGLLDAAAAELPADRRPTVERHPYSIRPEWQQNLRHRARSCGPDWETRVLPKLTGTFENIEVVVAGLRPFLSPIVVGAHYDSDTCESGGMNPGADDNASGVAVLIELVRLAKQRDRTVRFVAFTNEEEPFFHTAAMGSRVYAEDRKPSPPCAMISLETLGYFADEAGSQQVAGIDASWLGLPNVGNFVAVVGNDRSRPLVRQVARTLKQRTRIPIEGLTAWTLLQGIDWSDHWSFWQIGVPAVMVTDTAPNRNHCYHHACDRPEPLDYGKLAEIVTGMDHVLDELAGRPGCAACEKPTCE